MKFDVVFPKGNEKEFAAMAERLGYGGIIFAYTSFESINGAVFEGIGQHFHKALAIDSKDNGRVISSVRKAKKLGALAFVKAKDAKFDRFVVEKSGADALFGMEYEHHKDHLHFRRGGLDQVMCRFARENKVTFLTSFSSLISSSNKPLIIGRIMQNLRFCSKYGVGYNLVSFAKNPFEMFGAHDGDAFLRTLGSKKDF